MNKLKLSVDSLRVESFEVVRGETERGTVRGHESYPNGCFPPSGSDDPFLDTCHYATCAGNTCWQSCNGTCNCGSVGCPAYSQDYTYCEKDASCINQCFPTGAGCG